MLPAASPDVGVSPAFTESVQLMKKATAQQAAVRTDAKFGLKHACLATKYVVISQSSRHKCRKTVILGNQDPVEYWVTGLYRRQDKISHMVPCESRNPPNLYHIDSLPATRAVFETHPVIISYCKRQGGLAKALIPPAPWLLCAPGQKFKQYVLIAILTCSNSSPRLIVVFREPALISVRHCCSRNLTTSFWPLFVARDRAVSP